MGTERITNRISIAKTAIAGLFAVLVAAWFWHSLLGNPLNDLALVRRAKTVHGTIIDASEDVGDNDAGGAVWTHNATYTYELPSGKKLTRTTPDYSGRLREDLTLPMLIEVEYLPENPEISRIKGTGSQSLSEWAWRTSLSLVLLSMFLSPGVYLLNDAFKRLRSPAT